MITLEMFSVYDEKAAAYLTPFFLPTEGVAIRTFMDVATDPNHDFGRHPADYTLHRLGVFDVATGELLTEKTVICTGLEAVAVARRDQAISLPPGQKNRQAQKQEA